MTIVMIGQKGLPAHSGGIERHVELLATGLAKRGHRVVVFGRRWYVGTSEAPKGVIQRLSPGIRTRSLDAITHSFTALLLARRERPDIIHIHGSGVEILTPLARLLYPKVKIVYTGHCKNYVLSKWGRVAKFLLRLSERVGCVFSHKTITVSQELMKHFLEKYGCQAVYIPHPFAGKEFKPDGAELAKLGLQDGRYLLFVGRLIQDKQAHVLLEAYRLARIARSELFADLPLVLVGGGQSSHPYVAWLYQRAAAIPGVRMLGERSGEALNALQALAFAHVFPTASEGLSLAVLEACAYARPVVATDLPQNREATGGKAYYIPSGDEEALSRALIHLVEMDSRSRDRMGHALRQYVCAKFSEDQSIQATHGLYQELFTRGTLILGEGSVLATAIPSLP